MSEKLHRRLFGGIGMLFLLYTPIRFLENKPAIFMLIAFPILGYFLGCLLDKEDE